MCAQVLDRQLSRGMSASDSAKVIRHGNTLPNSPRGPLANPTLQQIMQRATAILEVALVGQYFRRSDEQRPRRGFAGYHLRRLHAPSVEEPPAASAADRKRGRDRELGIRGEQGGA